MISFNLSSNAHRKITENTRSKRLHLNLTQSGLAERSGVPVATLRKFEQTGAISLESFLKIQMVLGGLNNIVAATDIKEEFNSIDEVLADSQKTLRKRGSRK